MRFAKVFSIQPQFPKPQLIEVEVDVSIGLFQFTIIGLPDKAVAEARDRVIAAIKNSGFPSPKTKNHKITVSLAPSNIKKSGTHLDLAIAIGYLLATQTISFEPRNFIFMAELSLDGSLKPGTVSPCIEPFASFKAVFTSHQQAVPPHSPLSLPIIQSPHLTAVTHLICDAEKWNRPKKYSAVSDAGLPSHQNEPRFFWLFASQPHHLKFAEVCAIGGFHTLLYGPPGTGKTALAHCIHELLPPLEPKQLIDVSSVFAAANLVPQSATRPLRKPHHTSSHTALLGNRHNIIGEIALASHGVLLLDEFTEFNRRVLESLREPLEHTQYGVDPKSISFQCIATTNLCPCGNFRSLQRTCSCSARMVHAYQARISGPLLERFFICLELNNQVTYQQASNQTKGKELFLSSLEKVAKGRRLLKMGTFMWSPDTHHLFSKECAARSLSMRGQKSLEMVCRVFAAHSGTTTIQKEHLNEALSVHISNAW